MLIAIGAYAFDGVTSVGHGLIVAALDIGLIGLALAGWWSLARWGRHHPELVVLVVAAGVMLTMVATAVAVPDLTIQSTGYLLILPGMLALLLPWRTGTYLAWLVAYVVVAFGYLTLIRNDVLAPHLRGDLFTVLIVASGASLAGHALLDRARVRSFVQVEHIRTLRRQGDAHVAHAQALEQRALHDPLTGLANRTLLGDRLAQALAQRATTVAVMMLDLDDFKAVNDRFGHATGDEVLVGTAERFTSELRAGDTLARLGGDEFAVVAPGVKDAAVACAIADRLLGSLGAPVWLGSARGGVDAVTVRASAGIALAEAGACDARELMRRADVALYRAKENGKNRWSLFEASMDTEAP